MWFYIMTDLKEKAQFRRYGKTFFSLKIYLIH